MAEQGNGYPISGILIRSNLADEVEASDHVQSHTDDPLGCSVARKVVEIMVKEQLVEQGKKTGEYLRKKLAEMAEGTGGIKEVRGRGMMNVVILNEKYKAKMVFLELLQEGLFTGYSENYNFIHLYAPLILRREEVDWFCKSLQRILQE